MNSMDGEARGVCQAMLWLNVLNLTTVIFKTSSKLVVDNMFKDKSTKYESLVNKCRYLLSYNNYTSVLARHQ